tara:strand:- start:15958 stop:16293 length:336 start_codon:yes stop_codon:yes gene_type:complete
MVASRVEATHMVQLMLKYVSPYTAKRMLDDMDFEIAEVTDNESLKESIKMVSELLNQAKTQITWSIKEPVTLKDNEKEYMDDTYGSDEAERRKTEAFKRMNDKRGKLGNIE